MIDQTEIETVAKQYELDGYEVVLNPQGADLPPFLERFPPDLIARGQTENVVVQVKPQADLATQHKLGYMAGLVNAQPGWRFDLVVTHQDLWPDQITRGATERSVVEIRSLAEEAGRLVPLGHPEAATMLAWSAVEATMRHVADKRGIALETNSPSLVIRTLYSEGVLSRTDHERLQEALRVRNAIAHGLKSPKLSAETPAYLIASAERLLGTGSSGKKPRARRVGSPS